MTSEIPIIMESQGGLGNQLFIWAAGRSLSHNSNRPLVLDTSLHAMPGARPFVLHHAPGVKQTMRTQGLAFRTGLVGKAARRIRRYAFLGREDRRLFVEDDRGRDPVLFHRSCAARYHGYFQSPAYFAEIDHIIRREIVGLLSRRYELMNPPPIPEEPWAFVHIRRGDYTTRSGLRRHGVLGDEYYRQSLDLIKQESSIRRLVIFSDEPRAAHRLAKEGVSLGFQASVSSVMDARDSLWLMSKAHAAAIANSSLSWWAAWLLKTPTGPVVYPQRWFANGESSDLQMGHWYSF